MKYLVELSTMDGTGLAEEHLSRFESDTPIPIPAVGDRVQFYGENGGRYVVRSRDFVYSAASDGVTLHVQVFCMDYEQYKELKAAGKIPNG